MTLQAFFTKYPKVALACSGGVDSAYLFYAAKKWGADVRAYFVKTPFQPEFEMRDAELLANTLGTKLHVLQVDVLADPAVAANPKDRCYFCKKKMFLTILEQAQQDGYSVLIDGTNASDDETDRPGMKALKELSVYSPLKMCGLTKEDIRRLAKEADLFTWNKPAYACLATRIPMGTEITKERLECVEQSEDFLRQLGCWDFRIRTKGHGAKLQVSEQDMPFVIKNRETIVKELKQYFDEIVLDLEVRR